MVRTVLKRDRTATTTHPPPGLCQAVREEQDYLDRRYPSNWDFYEDVVAQTRPAAG